MKEMEMVKHLRELYRKGEDVEFILSIYQEELAQHPDWSVLADDYIVLAAVGFDMKSMAT
jgi:hypothetical protein